MNLHDHEDAIARLGLGMSQMECRRLDQSRRSVRIFPADTHL